MKSQVCGSNSLRANLPLPHKCNPAVRRRRNHCARYTVWYFRVIKLPCNMAAMGPYRTISISGKYRYIQTWQSCYLLRPHQLSRPLVLAKTNALPAALSGLVLPSYPLYSWRHKFDPAAVYPRSQESCRYNPHIFKTRRSPSCRYSSSQPNFYIELPFPCVVPAANCLFGGRFLRYKNNRQFIIFFIFSRVLIMKALFFQVPAAPSLWRAYCRRISQ